MGRVKYAIKNITYGVLNNFVVTVLGFVLRTLFIKRLSESLLGVNGLYTDILTALSLADLGIGTAMNYALYKPVAMKDEDKAAAYLAVFKRAYIYIACIISIFGIAIIPFLEKIVKNPNGISSKELIVYYVIFLFNTVSSYFVSYKYSILNAEQKNYIQTNITTATKLVTVVAQCIVLFVFSNYLLFLLVQLVTELLQKVFVSFYLNRKYPILCKKATSELSKEEKKELKNNVKALFMHKIGDVARFQTDSIIISSLIQVSWVGYVNNYTLIVQSIAGFANIIFNSIVSSLGNLIATESKEKQYDVFLKYRFGAAWIYGFTSVGFLTLLSPLVECLWGEKFVISFAPVLLMVLDYYFKGFRIVLTNFKSAAGIFEQDKYISIIQGAVNLVLSVGLVKYAGLAGVYVGTVVSGLIANFVKPKLIYGLCFERKTMKYYKDSILFLCVTAISYGISKGISIVFPFNRSMLTVFCGAMMVTVVYNVLFALIFYRRKEFKDCLRIAVYKIRGNSKER